MKIVVDILCETRSYLQTFLRAGKAVRWVYLLLALLFAFQGPYRFQTFFLISTLFVGLSIYITRTGKVRENGLYEQRRVALVMLLYIVVNACRTYLDGGYTSSTPYNDAGFWFANRLLHLFGVAFFMIPFIQPLMTNIKIKEKTQNWTIRIAVGCIAVAFLITHYSRLEPCLCSESWYTPGNLMDDVLMSLGIGLLLTLFTELAGQNATPCADKSSTPLP